MKHIKRSATPKVAKAPPKPPYLSGAEFQLVIVTHFARRPKILHGTLDIHRLSDHDLIGLPIHGTVFEAIRDIASENGTNCGAMTVSDVARDILRWKYPKFRKRVHHLLCDCHPHGKELTGAIVAVRLLQARAM